MPNCRCASARARSGVISMAWRTPSRPTKSLPAPCIFTKFQIMGVIMPRFIVFGCAGAASVDAGFAFRPGLEAPVHPVVLRRVLANPVFDEPVQAGGGCFRRVVAGKVCQRRE